MFSGYWLVPWEVLPKLTVKPDKVLSIFALLLAAKKREALPPSVLVPNLDLLLALSEDVQGVAIYFRSTLSSAPTSLWRNAVIILPIQTIELDKEWKIKIRRKEGISSIPVKLLFPRANLQVIDDLYLCHSPIVIV